MIYLWSVAGVTIRSGVHDEVTFANGRRHLAGGWHMHDAAHVATEASGASQDHEVLRQAA